MIEVAGLYKSYGQLAVLKDFSMAATTGCVTAVVGPNGSGKTTLIKCLLGLVYPDSGSLQIDGKKVGAEASYREAIGYMPQSAPFPDNLTPREVIAMLKDLRGADAAIDETLIAAFELEPEMDIATSPQPGSSSITNWPGRKLKISRSTGSMILM